MIKRLLLYLILEFKLWTMFMRVTTLFPFDLANHFCEMAADYHYETPHILDHDEFGAVAGFLHGIKLPLVCINAGGLLVGVAINMHPYLFYTAILKVPFLDVCNTLLDSSLPLTILDHDEFDMGT